MSSVTLGVSFSFLEIIIKDKRYNAGLTTSQIIDLIVKPDTERRKCSYIDLYAGKRDAQGHLYIAPATAFVSHAWKYLFSIPIDVVRTHHKKNPSAYFWFDIFVMNQHSDDLKSSEWLRNTFNTTIVNTGTVLVCMSPWNDPVVLQRAWCLWEIFCSITAGSKVDFQICLPTSERAELKKGISENFNSILDALIKINAEKADSYDKNDRAIIFDAIEQGCGFDVLNNMVKDQLRKWYVETGADIADVIIEEGGGESESEKFGDFLYNLGRALDAFGNNDRAIYFLKVGLRIELSVNGEDNTGRYLNVLGSAYDSKGEFDKAINYYERALKINVASFGEDHPSVASSYNNLGNVYNSNGKYDKAIDYYERALKIQVTSLGEDHPSVASSYNNLGNAYDSKGEFDKAINYYERALKINVASFGEAHPSVASSYHNLGHVYNSKGEYDKAIDYYERDLKITTASLGEDHPSVASSYNNLSNVYESKGEFDKAINYYERALKIQVASLGKNHPDVATSYYNLGSFYYNKGNYDLAIEFFEKALTISMDTFGEDHPDTKMTQRNIVRAKKAKAESSISCIEEGHY